MSTLLTPIKEIAKLSFEPFPSRPINVVKTVRTDHIFVALAANGTLYSNGVSGRCAYLGLPRNGHELMACVRKLGVVAKELVDEYLKIEEEKQQRQNRKYAAEAIERNALELGLELTAKQLKVVEANKRKEEK